MKRFPLFLSTTTSLFAFSCQTPTPSTSASVADHAKTAVRENPTARQVLEWLPEAFFAPLQTRQPRLYASIAPLAARQALLSDAPVVHGNCLTYTLEPVEVKKIGKQEYQEFDRYNEINLCVYSAADGSGDFVAYVQIVKTCKGLCDDHPAELHLRLCKRYSRQNQKWTDFEADFDEAAARILSSASPQTTAYMLLPKGLCKRDAVADFERSRNRSFSADADMARLASQSQDACLVWTGKSFE